MGKPFWVRCLGAAGLLAWVFLGFAFSQRERFVGDVGFPLLLVILFAAGCFAVGLWALISSVLWFIRKRESAKPTWDKAIVEQARRDARPPTSPLNLAQPNPPGSADGMVLCSECSSEPAGWFCGRHGYYLGCVCVEKRHMGQDCVKFLLPGVTAAHARALWHKAG